MAAADNQRQVGSKTVRYRDDIKSTPEADPRAWLDTARRPRAQQNGWRGVNFSCTICFPRSQWSVIFLVSPRLDACAAMSWN